MAESKFWRWLESRAFFSIQQHKTFLVAARSTETSPFSSKYDNEMIMEDETFHVLPHKKHYKLFAFCLSKFPKLFYFVLCFFFFFSFRQTTRTGFSKTLISPPLHLELFSKNKIVWISHLIMWVIVIMHDDRLNQKVKNSIWKLLQAKFFS